MDSEGISSDLESESESVSKTYVENHFLYDCKVTGNDEEEAAPAWLRYLPRTGWKSESLYLTDDQIELEPTGLTLKSPRISSNKFAAPVKSSRTRVGKIMRIVERKKSFVPPRKTSASNVAETTMLFSMTKIK